MFILKKLLEIKQELIDLAANPEIPREVAIQLKISASQVNKAINLGCEAENRKKFVGKYGTK